jgi:creatinine amidohydrolase
MTEEIPPRRRAGAVLEHLTWPEAEPLLRADPVVVLPIGSGAKEHGPHLPLGTDRLVADYLGARLVERVPVLVLPTLPYGYYPAFTEFPGSTHVEAATFGAFVRDIILSMHGHGPRRFLVLNTGISTAPALEIVARDLQRTHGLLVGVTRIEALGGPEIASMLAQPAGTHADERETSLLLAIAADAVRMDRAVRDVPAHPPCPGLFVPGMFRRTPGPFCSATGVSGDATLATRDKGERIAAALIDALVAAAAALQAQGLA